MRRQTKLLIEDVLGSFTSWRLWVSLGWNDIAKQYRRSFIGPVWIALNTAIFIIGFGYIGAQLFKTDLEDYLPYFCAGQVIFTLLSSLLSEGCSTFVAADTFIKQAACSKTLFVSRVVFRNLLMFLHNAVVVFGVLLWFGKFQDIRWGEFLLALPVTFLAGWLVVAIVGVIATRFRDVPMIITSLLQLLFFVTPVMWRPAQLTARAQVIIDYNPFAVFLGLVRAPLLGQSVPWEVWRAALLIIAALGVAFVGIYLKSRKKIVYWL
ncbi:MAG: ABC transporter permease [Rhodoferax sp.]